MRKILNHWRAAAGSGLLSLWSRPDRRRRGSRRRRLQFWRSFRRRIRPDRLYGRNLHRFDAQGRQPLHRADARRQGALFARLHFRPAGPQAGRDRAARHRRDQSRTSFRLGVAQPARRGRIHASSSPPISPAGSASNRDVLVYVHGFNTSLDEARFRLAQSSSTPNSAASRCCSPGRPRRRCSPMARTRKAPPPRATPISTC